MLMKIVIGLAASQPIFTLVLAPCSCVAVSLLTILSILQVTLMCYKCEIRGGGVSRQRHLLLQSFKKL